MITHNGRNLLPLDDWRIVGTTFYDRQSCLPHRVRRHVSAQRSVVSRPGKQRRPALVARQGRGLRRHVVLLIQWLQRLQVQRTAQRVGVIQICYPPVGLITFGAVDRADFSPGLDGGGLGGRRPSPYRWKVFVHSFHVSSSIVAVLCGGIVRIAVVRMVVEDVVQRRAFRLRP